MKFKYKAPNEYSDLTSGFREVESEYDGPLDFKVFVDKVTRKLVHGVEFDHDGPVEKGGSDNSPPGSEMFLLHSHNPNHIVLMAMITNCEDHTAENKVEVVCEKYNMQYQRYEPPTPDHTYNFKECTIDERGVVTYPWYIHTTTWNKLVEIAKIHKNTIRERQRVDILTQEQQQKADYCCEILDYIITNEVSKKHPWKVAFPDILTVTLDNSIPIGIPDGIPNGPKVNDEKTTAWGIVCHDHCCHKDGEDVVLEAICPTTPEEAAALEPWCCTDDIPSHCAKVAHYHSIDDELCSDPMADVSFEEIAQKHQEEWEKLKAQNS